MKEVTINIRANRRVIDLIDAAADIEGKTRSAFLRDCAIQAARAVFPAAVGDRCPLCGQLQTQ